MQLAIRTFDNHMNALMAFIAAVSLTTGSFAAYMVYVKGVHGIEVKKPSTEEIQKKVTLPELFAKRGEPGWPPAKEKNRIA